MRYQPSIRRCPRCGQSISTERSAMSKVRSCDINRAFSDVQGAGRANATERSATSKVRSATFRWIGLTSPGQRKTNQTTQTAADTPASAGVTNYADSAKAMIDNIHAMSQEVPLFTIPADDNANRKLATTGSVPKQAIDKVLAMIQQRPLLTGNDFVPDHFRDPVAYATVY